MRCEECRNADQGTARGWIAVLVDLPDDNEAPEVVIFCPSCAAEEFGEHFARRKASSP
jgi:hypothetical protein